MKDRKIPELYGDPPVLKETFDTGTFIMENILSFLRDLSGHNNREWFNDHKDRYRESLENFRVFTEKLLDGIVSFDPTLEGISAKDAIFRIYRDVRFSKDKKPYKTHFGSWMTRGGRKSEDAGYYFHLEPGNTFMAAGVYMPPREPLRLIRQEIMFNPEAYLKIIRDRSIAGKYDRVGLDDRLKRGPAGFPSDFEHLDELKFKHYVFSRSYRDDEIQDADFPARVIADYRGLHPLVGYLNHAMSFTGNQ